MYCASAESLGILSFNGIVGHRAELQLLERKQSLGSDAALAALKSNLASIEQSKQANAVNFSNAVVAEPKNRWEAARAQKKARRRGLLGSEHGSPSLSASGTPRHDPAPTSVPPTEHAARTTAMRTPLLHLLAMRPMSREDIVAKTHIPRHDLDDVLSKIGKQEQGKWQLSDRAFKELDVWRFGYRSRQDRQAAIDNAIRAYDRLRLGKDEKIWQMLLPREQRDQGIVLSKLHLGNASAGRGSMPSRAASPLVVHGDGTGDGKVTSTSNTPKLGPSSTPRAGAGKSEATTLSKRLFSKDPKKTRAAEEAKEKKRKDREAAAASSDKEGTKPPVRKKQATNANNPKVKSAEIVQDSSEEDEGALVENSSRPSSSHPKAPASGGESTANAATAKQKASSNAAAKKQEQAATTARSKTAAGATPKTDGAAASKPVSSSTSHISKPAANGNSPRKAFTGTSSQHRSQLSPQKHDRRPPVPSPLGAARPRVASDVSDRAAIGVQRVRQGAETPQGLGITNGTGKRHGPSARMDSPRHARLDKTKGERTSTKDTSHKSGISGSTAPQTPLAGGSAHRNDRGTKRKAVDDPAEGHSKHRKTESGSSQSQKSQSGSVGANSSTDTRLERSASSDSSSSITNDISYNQGVELAARFSEYYPRYAKLYDEQAAMEKRGEAVAPQDRRRLWTMHRRLETMKREIRAASQREYADGS